MKTQKQQETFIVHMLNKGFEIAAQSFSKIVNRNIKINAAQALVIRHEGDFSYVSEDIDEVYVLTTQLMGDFSGKSYLIISQEEADEIFKSVDAAKKLDEKLREALLLEIDNILSASVISSISNEMNSVVYGDVPKLKRVHSDDLHDFLSGAYDGHEAYSIVYSVATFKFDNRDKIHPQFIWKLSSRIFDLIPISKEAAA
jgi:chemotaxis protein CheY-P-specific phosphatase CheC